MMWLTRELKGLNHKSKWIIKIEDINNFVTLVGVEGIVWMLALILEIVPWIREIPAAILNNVVRFASALKLTNIPRLIYNTMYYRYP